MNNPVNRHLIVVYHENCIDGLASAWAFDRKWGQEEGVHISYIPYGHKDIPGAEEKIRKELTAGAELFFADVAPKKEFLDALMTPLASGLPPLKTIQVLDHHKTASEELAGYAPPAGAQAPHLDIESAGAQAPRLDIEIDPNHPSAANMIWEKLLPDRAKPVFLALISKMDLARDLKDDSDLAAAALIDSKNIRDIADAFHSFGALSALSMHDLVAGGRSILSDQENRIEKLTDNILYTRLTLLNDKLQEETLWIPVINADVQNFGRHISDYLREQGDRTGLGMAFAWYVQGNGTVTMSIRSDGDPDASLIAEVLCNIEGVTGGGHKTSAAVHFPSLRAFIDAIQLHTQTQMNELKKKELVPPPVIDPAGGDARDGPGTKPPAAQVPRATNPKYPKFG